MDEEIKDLLSEILEELKEIRNSIDAITLNGVYNLSDVDLKLGSIDSTLDEMNLDLTSVRQHIENE